MGIPEGQLETRSKQGPTSQFTATYDAIGSVLREPGSPYAQHELTVFLQGSYKNDTNIYGDSDVDIVTKLEDVYYSDMLWLEEEDKRLHESTRSPATYNIEEFKQSVTKWLTSKYGKAIRVGSKAIYVAGSNARRNADVIIAAELRRFRKFKGLTDQEFEAGICFFLPDGGRIENFPKQHSDNCTRKHQETSRWFKPTVRTFKNLRNKMINDNLIEDGLAPSYFLEGLLYNVPADRYGGSYTANFNDVLDWLLAADRSDFVCANGMFYLLRDGSAVTWTAGKCNKFLNAVKQTRDNWR